MAKILSQNYSYANNSSGDLINVSTAQRNEKYFCPICGELMNPHMGKVRRWHFVHKNLGNCSYESYLHKLAKIKIREAFLSSEHFLLSYNAKAICSLECPFIGFPKCEGEKPVEFDLRRYYDTCEIEATYHQYRADLLLTSSTNPKIPPVLIEIMVTHKCTEDKIKNGVRIIEIPIQSEEQIDNIVNCCKLAAVRDNHNNSNDRNITLYNFDKVELFVHKNAKNCSYESKLHKLAKLKIRKAFLSSEHFLLSYNAKAICSLECPFIGFPKCEGEKPVEYDLRRYYDTCEIEATYHQYRADLLLTSSTNPKTPPVLIEIMVTHKRTEDKIRDGVRIIEIPIQSKEQIDNIVNNCKLTAERDDHYYDSYSNGRNITLYNFNKVESFDPIGRFDDYEDCFSRKNTIVFWLNSQGQFRSFDCHCYEVGKKLPSNVHYYITEIATPFKEIFQEFSKRGVKIRNCFLCKFSKQDSCGERLCVLYKKHNLPRKPSPYCAVSCPHYKEDFVVSQNMVSITQPISTEHTDYSQRHKYYYHVCKDIL